MPIPKEDDKSPWEQYHIILLSRIVMYWIWSMLDPDERLLVTGVSPPVFGSQHCYRFRNRMQLNMDVLRWNTLYNKLPFHSWLSRFGIGKEVYYTKCFTEGHPCLSAFDYGSENNGVSQRLVEKLQLPTTFHLDQAWIKFSTWQCVKEVLCDIAPMDSCHLL